MASAILADAIVTRDLTQSKDDAVVQSQRSYHAKWRRIAAEELSDDREALPWANPAEFAKHAIKIAAQDRILLRKKEIGRSSIASLTRQLRLNMEIK